MSAEPAAVIQKLGDLSDELEQVSSRLNHTERALEPVQLEYDEFIGNYEVGLWNLHIESGNKLPAKDLRIQLAHKAMKPELLGRYMGLLGARKRGESRLRALKAEIDAQRSILSALKYTLEADGSRFAA